MPMSRDFIDACKATGVQQMQAHPAVLTAAMVLWLGVAAICASGSQKAAEPWAAPRVPPAPRESAAAGGVHLTIAVPSKIVTGDAVELNLLVENRGGQKFCYPELVPSWLVFPQTWCWGPEGRSPTGLLRYVGGGYRTAHFTSLVAANVAPGQNAVTMPLLLSQIFDLTLPGEYQAQLAGMGMISNVVTFRVLAPQDKPQGPAIRLLASQTPKGVVWGKTQGDVQMAADVKNDPGLAEPIARVQILFRCAGPQAAPLSLTGNPHVDFAQREMVGPYRTKSKFIAQAIAGKPVPLTAYGKLLAKQRQQHLPAAQTYTLKPGVVYAYWRPLVLNREFDLSVYGPYRFSLSLHGTTLNTAPSVIYVGVQSRSYKGFKIP